MEYEIGELLPVVAWLTDKYTGKESGSVTYETANQLMEAVLYCINEPDGLYDTAGSTAVYDASGRPDAREAYNMGYERVFRKAVEAKKLYGTIMKNFCAYGNLSYDETVRKGMPEFFVHYDARFNPQDHILTLDYPVLADLSGSSGADRIYRYLTCINLEQLFLNRFPEKLIREVAAAQNPGYQSMFLNIGGMILRHVEGCMLIGKPIRDVHFEASDYERLSEVISGMAPIEMEAKLGRLLEALLNQGFPEKEELFRYLSADIPEFRAVLLNAAQFSCLNAVL